MTTAELAPVKAVTRQSSFRQSLQRSEEQLAQFLPEPESLSQNRVFPRSAMITVYTKALGTKDENKIVSLLTLYRAAYDMGALITHNNFKAWTAYLNEIESIFALFLVEDKIPPQTCGTNSWLR